MPPQTRAIAEQNRHRTLSVTPRSGGGSGSCSTVTEAESASEAFPVSKPMPANTTTVTIASEQVADDETTTNEATNATKTTTTTTKTEEEQEPPPPTTKHGGNKKPFYGDLVRAIAFTGIIPVSAIDVFRTGVCEATAVENEDAGNFFFFVSFLSKLFRINHDCRNAWATVGMVAISCGLMWASYWKHSHGISNVGFGLTVFLCSFMDLNQWPYSGESLVTTIFPSIIVGNFFNGALSARNHLCRMAVLFGAATIVADRSPYAGFREDVLPGLGIPILIATAVLAVTRMGGSGGSERGTKPSPPFFSGSTTVRGWIAGRWRWWFGVDPATRKRWTVRGSRCLLAGIYLHHASSGLLSATEAGTQLTARAVFAAVARTTVVALVGIAANGTFEREIETNDRLETLVKKRTEAIRSQNEKLHMVELALRCSETAIAITDSETRMVWTNAACESLAVKKNPNAATTRKDHHHPHTHHPLLGKPIVEAIALETIADEKKLQRAFSVGTTDTAATTTTATTNGNDHKNIGEETILAIDGKIFRLEVSPYHHEDLVSSSSPSPSPSSSPEEEAERIRAQSGGGGHRDARKNDGGIDSRRRFLVVLKNVTADRAREVAEKTAREEAMLAKAMGDSMVTLTHELRTPMQGIMGVTGMLLQQKETAKDAVLNESLKLIMASSGLLLNLINNLLDVKKVNSESEYRGPPVCFGWFLLGGGIIIIIIIVADFRFLCLPFCLVFSPFPCFFQ